MASKRPLTIGEYPGQPVGTMYDSRREAMEKHVHTQSGRGIDARIDQPGAGAICPSGGYVDDIDHGDWILYTGQGGRDRKTGRQIANQSLDDRDNAALVYSHNHNWPVRVLRGNGADIYAPATGYRYDGLYWVDDYWTEPGADGFTVCRFLMVQLSPEEALAWVDMSDYPGQDLPTVMRWSRKRPDRRQPPTGRGDRVRRLRDDSRSPLPPATPPRAEDADGTSSQTGQEGLPEGNETPGTTVSMVYRKQRDSSVSRAVKALYGDRCQVCHIRISLAGGPYSEGAHIRPIGEPHNGADKVNNMLCLCPNHHVMFDRGGLHIANNLFVYERDGSPVGPLNVDSRKHLLNPANLAYHRRLHGFS
ncbi:putative restriction endonuclease [Nocardioides thalensis]|uniref:Putative restriction endonuclease n=1 Tax=Nocardioides thalensis TaxID=1914755 RepID=A0A853BYM6_9ACTN|nr:YDG/SRA domain-containing protein [Nocardioides thalensis]NYI99946.1 putative restriction endonuclease [Nocardioides thalensis]